MKRLMVILAIAAFVGSISGSAFAEGASGIGYVDMQKVISEYKETTKAQDQLQKEQEEYQKDLDDSKKKVSEAEKKNMKREELDKLVEELRGKLKVKEQSLLDLKDRLGARLQLDIRSATTDVAKKVGIDIVFDKMVVITGGVDLTEMVLNKLNEGK